MVGTLVKIGAGKWPVTRVSEILVAQNRDLAGPTAPAHGLCLMEVRYDDEINA
jgi:tRNA pseudouridine38-40 synthase